MIDGARLALDSMCLVYWLEQPDSRRGRAVGELYESGREFIVSAVSFSEIMVGVFRKGLDWRNAADALLTLPRMQVVDVDSLIALEAARLRATGALKLPDALVVATALNQRADALVSNDRSVVNGAPNGLRCVYLDDLAL